MTIELGEKVRDTVTVGVNMEKPELKLDRHVLAYKQICAVLDQVCKEPGEKFKILGAVEMQIKIDEQFTGLRKSTAGF